MKVLKVFLAIILSAFMICSTVLTLGSFATERATSEESIRIALDETNIIDTLMDEVLRENTVNMGGAYGSAAKAIMQSEPMEQFIADYVAAALSAELYGKPRDEIASDALMAAFAQGIEEAEKEKNFALTATEYELIRATMLTTIPALTSKLNDALDQYETTSLNEEMEQRADDIRIIVSPVFRYGSMAVSLFILILLVLLFWKSRMGFMWAAVNTIIAASAYGVAAMVATSFGGQTSAFVSPAERMLYIMIEYGSLYIAIAGGIAGVIQIIICVILRALRRRSYELY